MSSTTAYEFTLPRGERKLERLREKIVDLTISKFVSFLKLSRERGGLTAKNVTSLLTSCDALGGLQVACFMRHLKIDFKEHWTEFSGKYIPTRQSPEEVGNVLANMVESRPVLNSIINACVPTAHAERLWTARHVEHGGCEWRKMIDNCGDIYHTHLGKAKPQKQFHFLAKGS